MSKYAVVGNPIKHSKSPKIHTMFAEQTGEGVNYEAILLGEDEFDEFVTGFFERRGGGLNVTVPFKEKAFALVKCCTERASLAKAVNTLYINKQGELAGDNTDGVGLVRDIKINHGFEIAGSKILILGAGGAVRGALSELVNEQAKSITIANRTVAKANQLCAEFDGLANVSAQSFTELHEQYDLIINGTSLSLEGQLPPISNEVISSDCCCYDMMYGTENTVFVSWAHANGAKLAVDGLGMLVEQAAESFAIWRGVRPKTTAVITALSVKNSE